MHRCRSDAQIGIAFANYLAVPGTKYEDALFELLDDLEAKDKLVPFLQAAQDHNPDNPDLQRVLVNLSRLEVGSRRCGRTRALARPSGSS